LDEQFGTARAALEFAVEDRIPHGGWCPKGRLDQKASLDLETTSS
jgi:hypothetical protein